MGMGLDTPISEDENNPTHSMSSVDIDVEEAGDEGSGHDTRDSPETVVRAKFAFTGEGEDEVCQNKKERERTASIIPHFVIKFLLF